VTLASTWAKAVALAPRHKIATATDVALRAENFTCFIFKTPKGYEKGNVLDYSCFCMFQFRDSVVFAPTLNCNF